MRHQEDHAVRFIQGLRVVDYETLNGERREATE